MMTQMMSQDITKASDGETFVPWSKNCIREIYRKFGWIIIAIHEVPTVKGV